MLYRDLHTNRFYMRHSGWFSTHFKVSWHHCPAHSAGRTAACAKIAHKSRRTHQNKPLPTRLKQQRPFGRMLALSQRRAWSPNPSEDRRPLPRPLLRKTTCISQPARVLARERKVRVVVAQEAQLLRQHSSFVLRRSRGPRLPRISLKQNACCKGH